ncbi:tetratricopeptide repeat protein 23 isoform X3 [Stegostoma tigrinum]|uniref:tetratricopeptide repeat protein 23 isoform X3 n=1 Tax=Stegostoma tigrinum TaxID=3053191 RepID=UPI00286FC29B|nr:tetratricopeptide repeat protein 23 isoform X3 [Stegostoma tigrinum]
MNSALLDQGPEEDLDSECSSRTFSAGEETQLCDTGRSSEGARTPSTPNERARFRRRHRNGMKEAAIMIPPEEKLVQSEQRARIYAASQEVKLKLAEEAEQNLLKSEKVADELQQAEEVPLEEIRQVNAEITLTLGRLYMKENKTVEAVACYEKVLQMVKLDKGENSMECVSIYRDLAAAERARGAHDISTQLLMEAHSIVLTNAASGEEEGQITLALAEAYASTGRTEDHHLAEKYYKQSLQCYQTALGAEHATSLSVLDDYSRFLILAKNYSAAARLLHESLRAKLSTFGDFSKEVEETYHLFGGIDLAEGHQKAAYKMFKKCLGIQTFLYGSQHKKTRATQETVKLLSKSPEVAAVREKTGADNLKQRPVFCAVVPKHSISGGTRANIYS